MKEATPTEATTSLSQLIAQLIPVAKPAFPFGFLRAKIGPIDDSMLFAMADEEADQLLKKPY